MNNKKENKMNNKSQRNIRISLVDSKETTLRKRIDDISYCIVTSSLFTLGFGESIRRNPKVNCSNCAFLIRNEEGFATKCGHPVDPHGVYVPKTDTYNGYPWELGPNYRDPKTGEDLSDEEVRNIENIEESDIRLLEYSIGKKDPGILRKEIRRMYSQEIFISRLPYVKVGERKAENPDFCLHHQINRALMKGLDYCVNNLEILRPAFIVGPMDPEVYEIMRPTLRKFKRVAVEEVSEPNGLVTRKYKSVSGNGVFSTIVGKTGEVEEVFVPVEWMTNTSSLFKAIFINNKGGNIYDNILSGYLNKGIPYSEAKKMTWERMKMFVPKILLDIAEHNTEWQRVPHPINEETVREAKKALAEMGIEVPKDTKPQDIFKMYREAIKRNPSSITEFEVKLEGKEKLATVTGCVATTPKGTLIDRAAQEKYANTTYVVATKAGKMLAYEFNELPLEKRMELVGVDNTESKEFVYEEGMSPLEAILNFDEESFVDWAMENPKRAHKLLVDDFKEEMKYFREEALPNLSDILYKMERSKAKERRCEYCGKKLSQYNHSSVCFSCQEEVINE